MKAAPKYKQFIKIVKRNFLIELPVCGFLIVYMIMDEKRWEALFLIITFLYLFTYIARAIFRKSEDFLDFMLLSGITKFSYFYFFPIIIFANSVVLRAIEVLNLFQFSLVYVAINAFFLALYCFNKVYLVSVAERFLLVKAHS